MKNGYIIGADKLSEKKFSDKYWRAGDAEFQFHTMDISDGLDERQQLLINNDRALFENGNYYFERTMEMVSNVKKDIDLRTKKGKRAIATLAATNAAIIAVLIMTIRSLHNQ